MEYSMEQVVQLLDGLEGKIDKRFDNLTQHFIKLEEKLDKMQENRSADIQRIVIVEMEHKAIKEDLNEFKETEKVEGVKTHNSLKELYLKTNALDGKIIKISSYIGVAGLVVGIAIKVFL